MEIQSRFSTAMEKFWSPKLKLLQSKDSSDCLG